MDYIKDIHQLSFVFMYTLDLDIVKSIERNVDTSRIFDPFLKLNFILSLDLNELLSKVLIIGIGANLG